MLKFSIVIFYANLRWSSRRLSNINDNFAHFYMWTKIEKLIFTQWQSCAVTLSPLSRDINICHEVFIIKTNH